MKGHRGAAPMSRQTNDPFGNPLIRRGRAARRGVAPAGEDAGGRAGHHDQAPDLAAQIGLEEAGVVPEHDAAVRGAARAQHVGVGEDAVAPVDGGRATDRIEADRSHPMEQRLALPQVVDPGRGGAAHPDMNVVRVVLGDAEAGMGFQHLAAWQRHGGGADVVDGDPRLRDWARHDAPPRGRIDRPAVEPGIGHRLVRGRRGRRTRQIEHLLEEVAVIGDRGAEHAAGRLGGGARRGCGGDPRRRRSGGLRARLVAEFVGPPHRQRHREGEAGRRRGRARCDGGRGVGSLLRGEGGQGRDRLRWGRLRLGRLRHGWRPEGGHLRGPRDEAAGRGVEHGGGVEHPGQRAGRGLHGRRPVGLGRDLRGFHGGGRGAILWLQDPGDRETPEGGQRERRDRRAAPTADDGPGGATLDELGDVHCGRYSTTRIPHGLPPSSPAICARMTKRDGFAD
ncbi:protein of unknown function [Methylorubrum extorquens]|uniref:Uncharacterized protein n=1 Tax=Methylorubrum extorquens TaxID=408 RepID=A0A2N9AVZ3_METEX|nr:protein of unknown function [Methylorubrum extorquens]